MFVCEKDNKRKSKKVKVKVALARNKFCYKVLANCKLISIYYYC